MGSGSFSTSSFASYSTSLGRTYDKDTGRVKGQTYEARHIDEHMRPYKVMRECCNTDEHPNTIPVILALDVTGSMGSACTETAAALGTIMSDLYARFKDVQIMVMGIGDMAYDRAPIQISQFESDVRIAEWLDKVWIEFGGGGNSYESYSAAWYMGLYHTKLDAYDKQGRKGIIITMGDEPMNPYLPKRSIVDVIGDSVQGNIETRELYADACKKFDIYHIAVNDLSSAYWRYENDIKNSFGQLLGDRLKVSTINGLGGTICDCIEDSVNGGSAPNTTTNNDGISW